jgi:putative FmdB family regulatory protein
MGKVMPAYDYDCLNPHCAKSYVYLHLGSNDKVPQCPHCGSNEAEKKVSPGMTPHFKGPGFYVNDYKKKGGRS